METRLLKASEGAYAEAARQLMAGEVVGIPTETVYGLAADALNRSRGTGRFLPVETMEKPELYR
mgnify:CR=1 FL=1